MKTAKTATKAKAKTRAPAATASKAPPSVGILATLLRLYDSLTHRERVQAAWTGTITFPTGGAYRWRTKTLPHGDETVGAVLDRLAEDAARGRRWLDVRVTGDVVELRGWEWREDWERLDAVVGALFEAAAPLAPRGAGATYGNFRGGETSWVTRTFSGKKLVIDEGDTWPAKKAKAAFDAVQAGRAAWFAAHPETLRDVEHSGNWGYVGRDGREIIAPIYRGAYEVHDGLAAVVQKNGGYRLIDTKGKAIPGTFAMARHHARGLAPVAIERSDRWGYVDRAGTVKIKPTFAEADSFWGPLAVVTHGPFGAQKRRWLTPEGELIGDPFDYTSGFAEDRAWVYTYGNDACFRCVDALGRRAIARGFANGLPFSEGLAATVEIGSAKWGYVDVRGGAAIAARFDEAHPFSEGRAVVRLGKEHRLIDRKGTFVGGPFGSTATCSRLVSEGMVPFVLKGKVGFLTGNGEVAIKPKYHSAYGFYEGRGYVSVPKKNGGGERWGHIDRVGEYVVLPSFEWTNRFFDGRAPVKVDGLYGFIDEKGSLVVPPKYKRVQPRFNEGLAWVELP